MVIGPVLPMLVEALRRGGRQAVWRRLLQVDKSSANSCMWGRVEVRAHSRLWYVGLWVYCNRALHFLARGTITPSMRGYWFAGILP